MAFWLYEVCIFIPKWIFFMRMVTFYDILVICSMYIHYRIVMCHADGNILLHFGYMQYVNMFHADGKILWHFALVVCTWIFFHVDVLACHCLYFPSWKIFFMILIYFMAYSYAESIFYSRMDFSCGW